MASRDATPIAEPQAQRVYLSPPHMGPQERALLLDAFDSNWIAPLGPHVDAFEREVAQRVGVRDAAALSSGTAALHLALVLLGVQSGDEVITSTLTFSATANAITYVGATPGFVDVDRETWQLSPALLEEELAARAARSRLPKAVISVDLYGQCADYDAIRAVTDRYEVPLIEDAAEALGATYKGRAAGSLAELGVFSFNGNKIITASGGGMLVSNDSDRIARARFLATQARDPAPHYQHSHIGYNYRMSNLLAAIGRGQLQVLEERVAQRRAHNTAYREALESIPGVSFMPEAPYGKFNGWLTCLLLDCLSGGEVACTPEELRLALEAENIEARPVWKPLHLQPVFRDCPVRGGAVAEELFARGLCLPSGSSLSTEDRSRVVETIRVALAKARAGEKVP